MKLINLILETFWKWFKALKFCKRLHQVFLVVSPTYSSWSQNNNILLTSFIVLLDWFAHPLDLYITPQNLPLLFINKGHYMYTFNKNCMWCSIYMRRLSCICRQSYTRQQIYMCWWVGEVMPFSAVKYVLVRLTLKTFSA